MNNLSSYLFGFGLLAAGVAYAVLLFFLLRYVLIGATWLYDRVRGRRPPPEEIELFADRDFKVETEPGAPVFLPAAKPYFMVFAAGIAISLLVAFVARPYLEPIIAPWTRAVARAVTAAFGG